MNIIHSSIHTEIFNNKNQKKSSSWFINIKRSQITIKTMFKMQTQRIKKSLKKIKVIKVKGDIFKCTIW